jgi:hypothetical protein
MASSIVANAFWSLGVLHRHLRKERRRAWGVCKTGWRAVNQAAVAAWPEIVVGLGPYMALRYAMRPEGRGFLRCHGGCCGAGQLTTIARPSAV